MTKWFYEHAGQPHGPFSTEEIKALVETGLLGAEEPVWSDQDPAATVAARNVASAAAPETSATATVSPGADRGSSAVPDWLDDVASLEASRRAAEEPTNLEDAHEQQEALDWLEDLRIWVGLDLHTAKQVAPGSASGIAVGDSIPIGMPVTSEAKRHPRSAEPASDAVPIAMPVSMPSDAEPVPVGELDYPVRLVDTLARQTLQETGFDFNTGRIVHPAKFRKWKQQKVRSTEANDADMTNASLFERFRQARTAIERWVEDDKRRQLILEGNMEQIKAQRGIQDIFVQYAGLGFRQKLEKYLEFLVLTRKKQT